jgi:tetratricopeptide (TPR) repeat protein
MRTARWRRVKELFESALELDSAQRAGFLDQACASQSWLRREVHSLLSADRSASGFLSGSAIGGFDEPSPLPEAIGPYRIEQELGRGGMGVVVRARHSQTGESVALKTVRLRRQEHLGRIRREIHALSRIRHPGIVRIVEQGLEGGLPWYAMELIEGLPLDEHCRGHWDPGSGLRGVERLEEVLGVVRRLCLALGYLHGEGLVHRDLKPGNVLVRPDGTPVLVDFGLVARYGGELSREALEGSGVLAGTVAYMAPRQLRGELADARDDLYALGCVVYELLTGRTPFEGETTAEVVRGHLEAEPEPPSQHVPGLPGELDRLVLRLLAKEPRERLGYAADVARALAALGARDGAGTDWPAARTYLYRPELAGRDEALSWLLERVQRLREGRGGLVLVGGESGVGKTHLVQELAREAQRRGLEVFTGECTEGAASAEQQSASEEMQSTDDALRAKSDETSVASLPAGRSLRGISNALQPLRGLLQGLADCCRERGAAETQRLLGPRAGVLGLYEPALANLPGQDADLPPAELPPEAARLRVFVYLSQTLAALAQQRPLLLILDDLQWADGLTLGFLDFLLSSGGSGALRSGPVLIVGTYRSEEVDSALAELLDDSEADRLELGRLGEPSVGAIVGDMLALQPPPEHMSRSLARHSEGNPLFVAEYLRAAVEEGLLHRDEDGRWQVEAPTQRTAWPGTVRHASLTQQDELPLPRSLRELLGRRLTSLPQAALDVARAGAVLGRESTIELLSRMTALPDETLLEAIGELIRRQVLESRASGAVGFAHDRIREVIEQRVSAEERALLHRAAAEAIETLYAEQRERHLAALGSHWECAGEAARARACYLGAARLAGHAYALEEAERLYLSYLALVESPTLQSVEARNHLAENVLDQQGRSAEALSMYELALHEAVVLQAPEAEARSLQGLAAIHGRRGEARQAKDLLERALALQRRIEDRHGEGMILVALAGIERLQGDLERAETLYESALAISRTIESDRRLEGTALQKLAILRHEQGRLEESRALHEQALAVHRALEDRRAEGSGLGNLAILLHDQGDLEAACSQFEQALAIHRAIGNRRAEGTALGNLGNLYADQGQIEAASSLFEQALAIHREVGNRLGEALTLTNLASNERRRGHAGPAIELYEQALAKQRELKDPRSEAITMLHLVTFRLEEGSPEEARGLWQQAMSILRGIGERRFEAIGLDYMALLQRQASGDLDEAGRLLREAERIQRSMYTSVDLVHTLCQQGHVALARGCSARAFVEEAQQVVDSLHVGRQSDLTFEVGQLRRAIEAAEAGRPLFRGERWEDIPEGLRRWLETSGNGGV